MAKTIKTPGSLNSPEDCVSCPECGCLELELRITSICRVNIFGLTDGPVKGRGTLTMVCPHCGHEAPAEINYSEPHRNHRATYKV